MGITKKDEVKEKRTSTLKIYEKGSGECEDVIHCLLSLFENYYAGLAVIGSD